MSHSNDSEYFFQTSDAIATNARKVGKSKNTYGDPINLNAKLLAVISGVGGCAFVAGGDGLARRVDLNSRKVTRVFGGATAPLTTLALSSDSTTVFAGCWDKTIHSWTLSDGKPSRHYTGGHSDFVKCVLATTTRGVPVLLSGSADATIIIWDTTTGRKLHVVKGHTRGVLDLAIDPASPLSSASPHSYEQLHIFSADSVREIRQWTISPDHASANTDAQPIIAHETSVNRLHFETSGNIASSEPDEDGPDLWTASSDKTAKRLVRSRGWEADTTLSHPDYVRDVLCTGDVVVTACRDEEVRVWDASSGKALCVYSGHFEEVTGLALVPVTEKDGGGSGSGKGIVLVSVSLDGTVRTWSLDRRDMQRVMEERARPVVEEEGETEEATPSMMTAEEEAELAELMDSD